MSNLNQTIAPRIRGDVSVPAYGSSAGFAVREAGVADPRHAAAMSRTAASFAQELTQKFAQKFAQGIQAWSPPT